VLQKISVVTGLEGERRRHLKSSRKTSGRGNVREGKRPRLTGPGGISGSLVSCPCLEGPSE